MEATLGLFKFPHNFDLGVLFIGENIMTAINLINFPKNIFNDHTESHLERIMSILLAMDFIRTDKLRQRPSKTPDFHSCHFVNDLSLFVLFSVIEAGE